MDGGAGDGVVTGPQRLGEVLRRVLDSLGASDPEVWERVCAEWEAVAGSPWDRHARPVSLTRGVLVVEAATPAAVSLLRYGVGGLRSRLQERFGPEVVGEVEVRPPSRPRRR